MNANYPLLSRIQSPRDLRGLNRADLPQLAQELRDFILQSVSRTGGHLSSNLGTVELTVALQAFSGPATGSESPESRLERLSGARWLPSAQLCLNFRQTSKLHATRL